MLFYVYSWFFKKLYKEDIKNEKNHFKKLRIILASHNLEKELQYEVKGKINKNGDHVVKATWSIISQELYALLNLERKRQAPEWFLLYMNKFENKLDKKFINIDKMFETMQSDINKRFNQMENSLNNVENNIKDIKSNIAIIKMTPPIHK